MTRYGLSTRRGVLSKVYNQLIAIPDNFRKIKNSLKTYLLHEDSNIVLHHSNEENTVESIPICPRLIDRLNSDDGSRHILGRFKSKFNFQGDPTNRDDFKPLVVLCTIQTRIEDSCNFAMEGLSERESVVLVVFRRIIGSVTMDSICSFYRHPRVSRTIFAGFDEKDIYFTRADEEFLKKSRIQKKMKYHVFNCKLTVDV